MNTQGLEFFRKMLSKVPGAVYAVQRGLDGALRPLYFSEGSAQIYECSVEELLKDGDHLVSGIHPDDRESLLEAVGTSARTLGRFLWSGRRVFEGGREKWIRIMSSPEAQEDGTIIWFGAVVDITEEITAQQKAEALLREVEEQRVLFQAVVDNLPVGVTIMDAAGQFIVFNPAAMKISGQPEVEHQPGQISEAYGVFRADRRTPFPEDQLPIVRALAGEAAQAELYVRNAGRPEGALLAVDARPLILADGSSVAMALSRDITEQRALEDELRERNRQLAAGEEEKSQLVERLRYAIDELSNPILQVWDDVLAMPLIGVVDSRRTADMAQRLLAEVARTQAQCVIVDLTGVEVVDTKTADNLIKLVRKIELIGARCLLTGIRPSVSETVVEIGVDFAGLSTLRNLKHGLQEALRMRRRQSRLDEGLEEEEARPRSRRRRED